MLSLVVLLSSSRATSAGPTGNEVLLKESVAPVQVVKVAGVSLWALFREKKEKPRN